jgi:hypothetical protein
MLSKLHICQTLMLSSMFCKSAIPSTPRSIPLLTSLQLSYSNLIHTQTPSRRNKIPIRRTSQWKNLAIVTISPPAHNAKREGMRAQVVSVSVVPRRSLHAAKDQEGSDGGLEASWSLQDKVFPVLSRYKLVDAGVRALGSKAPYLECETPTCTDDTHQLRPRPHTTSARISEEKLWRTNTPLQSLHQLAAASLRRQHLERGLVVSTRRGALARKHYPAASLPRDVLPRVGAYTAESACRANVIGTLSFVSRIRPILVFFDSMRSTPMGRRSARGAAVRTARAQEWGSNRS